MNNVKYTPTIATATIYLLLLIVTITLFFGRTKSFLRIDFLQNFFKEFYQHISNFSISYLLLSGVGFMWLMLGVPYKYTVVLAAFILASNFIYELWIGVLNTPDVVDAYYGLAGTLSAFIFLSIAKKFGFVTNISNQNEI